MQVGEKYIFNNNENEEVGGGSDIFNRYTLTHL